MDTATVHKESTTGGEPESGNENLPVRDGKKSKLQITLQYKIRGIYMYNLEQLLLYSGKGPQQILRNGKKTTRVISATYILSSPINSRHMNQTHMSTVFRSIAQRSGIYRLCQPRRDST